MDESTEPTGQDSPIVEVERSDGDRTEHVRITGEVDISNVHRLQEELAQVTARRPKQVIFDLSGLRFIDSSGLAQLAEVAQLVGHVEVRQPSDIVRRVIEITGLADVLHITD